VSLEFPLASERERRTDGRSNARRLAWKKREHERLKAVVNKTKSEGKAGDIRACECDAWMRYCEAEASFACKACVTGSGLGQAALYRQAGPIARKGPHALLEQGNGGWQTGEGGAALAPKNRAGQPRCWSPHAGADACVCRYFVGVHALVESAMRACRNTAVEIAKAAASSASAGADAAEGTARQVRAQGRCQKTAPLVNGCDHGYGKYGPTYGGRW
jgi:hypothetical protein